MFEIKDKSYLAKDIETLVLYEDYRNCEFTLSRFIPGTCISGKFYNCKFNNARLQGARFTATARFTNCDFTDADFSGASFNHASFDGCLFNWAKFNDCIGLFSAKLDAHCSTIGIKKAIATYTATRGHFLEAEIIQPKLIKDKDKGDDQDLYEYGYEGAYFYVPRVPRDLKATLVVSDEVELSGNKDVS